VRRRVDRVESSLRDCNELAEMRGNDRFVRFGYSSEDPVDLPVWSQVGRIGSNR